MTRMTDALVIGAGPSGLTAANALLDRKIDFLLVEAGQHLRYRERHSASDLGAGVGGAGLFSDGKFSYFPSGSGLYRSLDKKLLPRAYNWVSDRLKECKIPTEDFPKNQNKRILSGELEQKEYPSHYSDLKTRFDLIHKLSKSIEYHIISESLIYDIDMIDNRFVCHIYNKNYQKNDTIIANKLVLANGKSSLYGANFLLKRLPLEVSARRFEFGIRIEVPDNAKLFGDYEGKDVKLIWKSDDREARTFCTCRRGEIWNVANQAFSSLSGRADGVQTNFSNFGLLVRYVGRNLSQGHQIWERLVRKALCDKHVSVETLHSLLFGSPNEAIDIAKRPWFPKSDYRFESISERAGHLLARHIKVALAELLKAAPELDHKDTVCLFPAIEGIGSYPAFDSGLRLGEANIWCCGDASGDFRGIIPALVSGYAAGLSLAGESVGD